MRIIGFEKWLLTNKGKKASDMKTLTKKEFLKNRLWWAYHAGNTAEQIWMTTEVQQILEVLSKRKLPKIHKSRIEYVLQHKEDYSIQKL